MPNSSCLADRSVFEPLLATRPALKAATKFTHTDVAVAMDAKPSQALRQGRWKSSMWIASTRSKRARPIVAISAGNTGALMAWRNSTSRTMAGHRPGRLLQRAGRRAGESIVLDLGASIRADAQHLVNLR
jgi:glycerol-3-phosphate acyltransferase PlsX